MPYLAVASTSASAVTFMAVPGHEQAKDAVVIAQAYGVTANTAFADGRGPGGLADEERQFAACPLTKESQWPTAQLPGSPWSQEQDRASDARSP